MNETALQNLVLQAVKVAGQIAYHTHDSRRSQPGFPDLTIVGHRGVLFRELKSERGKPTADQRFWLSALTEAGADAAIWRPSDWPDVVLLDLNKLGRVQSERPLPSQAEVRRHLQRHNRS